MGDLDRGRAGSENETREDSPTVKRVGLLPDNITRRLIETIAVINRDNDLIKPLYQKTPYLQGVLTFLCH